MVLAASEAVASEAAAPAEDGKKKRVRLYANSFFSIYAALSAVEVLVYKLQKFLLIVLDVCSKGQIVKCFKL